MVSIYMYKGFLMHGLSLAVVSRTRKLKNSRLIVVF